MPHEVFLSYSTKDTAATEAVCLFLEAEGVRCWMAPRDIPVGHDWAESIIGALNCCPVMVLIYSANANASMQVTREVQRAFEKGLVVFPFRIEAVQPNPGLEYYLGSVHWLDALTPPLEAHMGKLAREVQKALKRHAEGGAAVPAFPVGTGARPAAPGAAPKTKKDFPVAAAVAVCLALGGGAWWFISHETKPLQSPEPHPLVQTDSPSSETTAPVVPGEAPTQQQQEGEIPSSPTNDPATAAVEPPTLPTPSPEEAPPQPPVEPLLPTAATPSQATRELPWRDSLGIAYIPVPATEVLFALWPTRVRDYETFIKATDREWKEAGFEQEPTHPAVNITWNDAQAFCDWLTEHEREADRLPPGYHYRLPTEAEWDIAVAPDAKTPIPTGDTQALYPWGTGWPPPKNAGNYDDTLEIDPFPHTAPVGSFAPNRFGLFDMGGNVWQWCAEEPGPEYRTARGGSWKSSTARELTTSHPSRVVPVYRNSGYGFRCVLAPAP